MRETVQPPPLLADAASDDGISSLRVVSAVVLLALSLAIRYRTAQAPPPVPQPVPERLVAGVDLPPLVPVPVAAGVPAPFSSPSAAAGPEPRQPARHADQLRARERPQVARAANRSSGSPGVRARRHHVAQPGSQPRSSRRSLRTRAQVRAEYLRSRDVVAALTGEDSGSAYLTQLAARRRAARPAGAAY